MSDLIETTRTTTRSADVAGVMDKLGEFVHERGIDADLSALERGARDVAATSGLHGDIASTDQLEAQGLGGPQPVKNWWWGWPF
jgi:hypothetical protein